MDNCRMGGALASDNSLRADVRDMRTKVKLGFPRRKRHGEGKARRELALAAIGLRKKLQDLNPR